MTLPMLMWAARPAEGMLAGLRQRLDPTARFVADAPDGAARAWRVRDAERQQQEDALYRLSALGIPVR